MDVDELSARQFLALRKDDPCPDVEKLMDDARAILLHTVSLRTQIAESGMQISPIWEDCDGQAALRAAVVPGPVELRHFEGKGMATLAAPNALRMIADAVEILSEEPAVAAHALQLTALLWLHDEAPVRPLGLPYKGHFKLLTLVLADFLRKVGAGFEPIEWLTSVGLLDAFHDPAEDPPLEQIRATMREKTARMLAEEELWMAALVDPGAN